MFQSYFLTTLRNLRKNRLFTAINVIGLAVGTLCCLYIVSYVEDQFSYDRQLPANTYRINSRMSMSGDAFVNGTASPPIGPQMKEDFPEVEQYTRVLQTNLFGVKDHLIKYKDQALYEKDLDYVDSTFFNVFSYHFVSGSPDGLKQPFSVVLLKSTADKIFKGEDPVGKVITIDNTYGKQDFLVAGVVDESLGKSHLHANIFVTMNSNGMGKYVYTVQRWGGENIVGTYVRLRAGTNTNQLESRLQPWLEQHGGQEMKQLGMTKHLVFEPVTDIHTTTGVLHEMSATTGAVFLRILLAIAFLVQGIACINFMNLSTARASRRAKEVGVRKVLGAGRGDLVRQFLGESFLLALIGTVMALPLLYLALPWLNDITGADVHPKPDLVTAAIFAALVAITGLVSGSYPAFYLAAFRVVRVIKGNFSSHISAAGIRRGLVVFQFTLSILLVSGIIVIRSQLRYVQQKDLGFDKDQHLIFFFRNAEARAKMDGFMDDLRQLSTVQGVSKSTNYPSQPVVNDWPFYPPGKDVASAVDAKFYITDENFVKTAGITLVGGRDFRRTDVGGVIINETMARKLGLDPATAAGGRLVPQNNEPIDIVGVMKDFNFGSLHEDVEPFMLWCGPDGLKGWGSTLSDLIVQVRTSDYGALLAQIQGIWKKDLPGEPFDYRFLSDDVQLQYQADLTLAGIINTFALVAILISCLGLFGLAAFSAEQRNKEIGIRKVLGASVMGIVRLLSGDFIKPVLLGFALATPLAWWAMHRWLESYAYRVPLRWWMFALAGGVALAIALVTVSLQAFRAARANPVTSLRSE
ncbi:MAG TPA: ABC transporter permease [Dinghuibacter sp.]|uniref:ABC transporter permease n=1 Tax=Dinghuibacter sp. TaxID=2024697 RepID=UPI002CE3CFC8|nr:ABC transporter permease [Dinghuibacter sp.]HTJ14088.1 ABC transporter permease [Dinghuibacter sp.]